MKVLNRNDFLKRASNSEERLLISKIIDKAELAIKKHEIAFTDFINPAEMAVVYDIVKNIRDVNFRIFGGGEDCERNIIGFSPEYIELSDSDFPIKAIKITRNLKFSGELSHRDYLGSILGLGIDRDKTGDIFVFDEYTLCFVINTVADYIGTNLIKVGKTAVKTDIIDIESVSVPAKNTVLKRGTVSSIRIDAVIGSAFNISRGRAQDFIKSERVNVNWSTVTSVSFLLKEGDMVSVRGLGRFRISEIGGKTKKDRTGVIFSMYV